jgi:hypothetical protein
MLYVGYFCLVWACLIIPVEKSTFVCSVVILFDFLAEFCLSGALAI